MGTGGRKSGQVLKYKKLSFQDATPNISDLQFGVRLDLLTCSGYSVTLLHPLRRTLGMLCPKRTYHLTINGNFGTGFIFAKQKRQ